MSDTKKENVFISDAFIYDDKDIYSKALKEQKAIEYLTKELDNAKKDQLLNLYNKFIKEDFFKTENGIVFLYMLRANLIRVFNVDEEELLSIPSINMKRDKVNTKDDNSSDDLRETNIKNSENNVLVGKGTKKNKSKSNKSGEYILLINKYKKRFLLSIIVIILLFITLIGMFVILNTSKIPTIINYETKIQNKYSNWEEDLKAREEKIRKIELKLNIKNKKGK